MGHSKQLVPNSFSERQFWWATEHGQHSFGKLQSEPAIRIPRRAPDGPATPPPPSPADLDAWLTVCCTKLHKYVAQRRGLQTSWIKEANVGWMWSHMYCCSFTLVKNVGHSFGLTVWGHKASTAWAWNWKREKYFCWSLSHSQGTQGPILGADGSQVLQPACFLTHLVLQLQQLGTRH